MEMEDLQGLLRIRVKRGINLVRCDTLSSDPFVVVTMGQQKLKTRVVQNNCNPEWNEELTLAIRDPNEPVCLELRVLETPVISTFSSRIGAPIECPICKISTTTKRVYDKDTFTSHDKMGDAGIDIKPFLEVQKLGLQELPDGTEIKRVQPTRENCLAEESRIMSNNGKIIQDMILRLRNVESGEVEVLLEWINVPGCKGL